MAAGGLVAAVSEAPEHGLTDDDAVTHLDLLVAIVAEVPVLPLPLGTTAPDDDAVREEMLTPAADQLERQLAAIADLVEVRLDLTFSTDALVADIAREDPDIARLAARRGPPEPASATGWPSARPSPAGLPTSSPRCPRSGPRHWSGSPTGLSSSLRTSRRGGPPTCLHRDQLAAADDAVARLRSAAAGRADVEYVGPLPVYSFLEDVPPGPEPAPPSRWGW